MIEEGHALLRGRPTKLLTKGNAYIHRFVRNVDAQPSGSQILIFFLVLAVLISRRPDLFLRPQFFAEDGAIWYAQAYNRGWIASLLIPNAGYLNAVQRLAAGLALTVPLKFAPLLMNCCGLLIQALPVPVLLSARCRTWASLQMRLGMAAIYVFIPNAPEVHVVVTDSQWLRRPALLNSWTTYGCSSVHNRVGEWPIWPDASAAGFDICLVEETVLERCPRCPSDRRRRTPNLHSDCQP